MSLKIAIIGGGAAGFFAAITAKETHPDASVIIYEKSAQLLAKVKISGGGRCNVTNACASIGELVAAYPRGGKSLKKVFHQFSNLDAMKWFEARGVLLVIDSENCVFPQSQSSQTIIDCFLSESNRLGIEIQTSHGIRSMRYLDQQWELELYERAENPPRFDKVIIATGGSPKRTGLDWLEKLGHQIEEPVPSLFTFNLPQTEITRLQGVVVENALVSLVGTKLKSDGPLLITHWGFSGPVILKLSAFGARILSDLNYQCPVQVNWIHETNQTVVLDELMKISRESANKNLSNVRPFRLPERLWLFLLEKCDLPTSKKWSEIGKKSLNKLVNLLTNDIYTLDGKTTFKEEFVTCGGVSLKSIDLETMKSKVCENLYFAGEILDIDGITGGYNFQAAWTTGFVAGQLG